MKKVNTVNIMTDEENPMPIELVAESIKTVANSMHIALNSGLTMKAICVLVKAAIPASSKIGLKDIETVLTTTSKMKCYITDATIETVKAKKTTPVPDEIITIDEMTKAMVDKALKIHKTNKEAAKALGISERTLYRYIK